MFPGMHVEFANKKEAVIKYCSKVDTSVSDTKWWGEWVNHPLRPKPKLREPLPDDPDDLYEWQMFVLNLIKQEPDDRAVYWFYEEVGRVGKSALAKHLVMHHDAVYAGGKISDVSYILSQRNDVRIVVYDIPRTNVDYVSYTGLEQIKNGLLNSPKYESRTLLFNPPHVLCFSNSAPKWESVSLDRWKVYRITSELSLERVLPSGRADVIDSSVVDAGLRRSLSGKRLARRSNNRMVID